MEDITIIMMTPNLVPKKWAKFHKKKLLEAVGRDRLISRKKLGTFLTLAKFLF